MKKVNAYLLITALLLIVVGVMCMLNPGEGFQDVAWLIGLLVLLSGGMGLLFGIRAKDVLPNAKYTIFMGVVQILVGLLFLFNKVLGATVLVVIFAIWVAFEGLSLAILSFNYKRNGYERWWIMLLLGVVSFMLGIVAMRDPSTVGVLFGILLGIGIFANGVDRIVAYTALKTLQHRVRDLKESATAIPIDEVNRQ